MMINKLSSYQPHSHSRQICSLALWVAAGCLLLCVPQAAAGDAPPWMHALVNAPLPAHDEKTDAIVLYAEEDVTVVSVDKIRTQVRRAYKILRPGGRDHYGFVAVPFDSHTKINSMHAWCIPASGKDFEVKEKDGVETSAIGEGELMNDEKVKILRIPASDPGNVVGYEYELEEQPMVLQDSWRFQHSIPTRESHYSLQLPSGWEYKVWWLNYAEVKPTGTNNQWAWTISDIKGIRQEREMPPFSGIAGQMIVSYFPPGGPAANGFTNWKDMGVWYRNLAAGRADPSPEIKQKVSALTAADGAMLIKMRKLAQFVQRDIRYVAIELGIGGFQPHPAPSIFTNRYGDCKDKATLMMAMLHEVGVDSYYVVINAERGSVTSDMPAHTGGFNHVILAVKLPEKLADPSLIATEQDPALGKILFFDPTDELTPFGQISGNLQANYGLLVTPGGGELMKLPTQPPAMNGITRTGKLKLDTTGKLTGEVEEMRIGDRAWSQRAAQRNAPSEGDRIKPVESLLADSLSTFAITKASVVNASQTDQPFGYNYSFEAGNYAKTAGNLLLVRPRVLGSKSSGILETKEPREFPIEFEGPARDTDTFEITLPAGYVVDELPPPVDADYGFASYRSKTEANGNVIRYTRTFEVKELSVPVAKAADLKKFYRIIASDERNTVVLKPAN